MRGEYADAQITLRTGHRSVQSLKPYANIMGEAGKGQQESVLKRVSTGENED